MRKRVKHVKRLVLVPRLQTLSMQTRRDDGLRQRIEQRDERA